MKFEFIGNAAGIFHGSKGTKVLCDPWIENGVFEGSWFHYPPLKTKIKDLYSVDAIYVSHLHPDHFDQRYFTFDKKIPIIILNEGPNFLKKNLINLGYTNLIEIKNDETIQFKEFELTMFKPFAGHIFEESILGNLIDSALVFTDGEISAINFNDNTPDLIAAEKLSKKFKNIGLAMLNYNAAGPYPSCFDNLTNDQKKMEHDRILKRNFDHLCKLIPILKPKTVLPFAGSYIIGGKNYSKNNYLGTSTWEECCKYLIENCDYNSKFICMREKQIYDILNQKLNSSYTEIDKKHMKEYINQIKDHKYDYEYDQQPDLEILRRDLEEASIKYKGRIKKFNLKINSNVYFEINREKIKIIDGLDKKRDLICKMDNRLLRRILDRKSHWNNSEIGTHISYYRTPNKMDADLHTSLAFFHL